MMNQLYLYVPSLDDLWYRKRIMSDPDTMSYNKGYNLEIDGYDNRTGCIEFPEYNWRGWFNKFIGNEPDRYYAYIVRSEDNAFIGEVCAYKSSANSWHEIGIVLEAMYRCMGYAEEALKLLLEHAFEEMGVETIHNYFEATRTAAVRTHLSVGFFEYKRENNIIELLITKERFYRKKAIKKMVSRISTILSSCRPSIYLYGSVVLDDFKIGWSDIDILVLTQERISMEQAQELLELRQKLLQEESDNHYYRSFEGGMLSVGAFVNREPDRVVYWGTSGQRITDFYDFDSFCMVGLLENGVLLYGEELRSSFKRPDYNNLHSDVQKHYEAIRKYAQRTDRSFYSFGWLLDIARGIYTLHTGNVISKTAAGQWALCENLCPVPKSLEAALKVRRSPLKYKDDLQMLDYAEMLGPDVQRFTDVLEEELKREQDWGNG